MSLDKGYLGDNPVRVDAIEFTRLRIPNGNEPGENNFWVPGGYTGEGVPEAIIDQIPWIMSL
ncbi:hypothetical protein Q75_02955 [Bacillus coahuilensis p1.1.43]|uniref:Uncharacterized protein n=1 Tax=Bacillus coahuilensis p1.1.43 TaxID=1150625 RepID=A0A147KB96_9BACI|nr:hypothetical protein [Bacillus coahuilensis]KUP08309.1 hypothetical protein Q75_02955 [Bacillus coahuilensis p1.1.43]